MIPRVHTMGSWEGTLKFFIKGEMQKFVGHIRLVFLQDFKLMKVFHEENPGVCSVRTFDFKDVYLIETSYETDRIF